MPNSLAVSSGRRDTATTSAVRKNDRDSQFAISQLNTSNSMQISDFVPGWLRSTASNTGTTPLPRM